MCAFSDRCFAACSKICIVTASHDVDTPKHFNAPQLRSDLECWPGTYMEMHFNAGWQVFKAGQLQLDCPVWMLTQGLDEPEWLLSKTTSRRVLDFTRNRQQGHNTVYFLLMWFSINHVILLPSWAHPDNRNSWSAFTALLKDSSDQFVFPLPERRFGETQ